MSKVAIAGNASGTGTFTIQAPNSNTDRVLSLPDEAGTVLTSASDIPAGNLTGDNPQSFIGARIYPSSNQTINNNTTTKIVYPIESFDEGGYWDTSNSRYTPPVGFYFFNYSFNFLGIPTGSNILIRLYKNGSEQFWTRHNPAGNNADAGVSGTFVFQQTNASDYWEIYGWQSSGADRAFESASGVRTWASFARLGA